eukprot:gb/GECH01014445.1/.p1 GENE.gb/GECH01014445.1/~~gb/GECH01014445.1/.p1  ORF type:complete len:490 (+),score=123.45 gb/GECH01014445.1/:1-1470(+)
MDIKHKYEQHGQGHVFQYWEELSSSERQDLLQQLNNDIIDVEILNRMFSLSQDTLHQSKNTVSTDIKPPIVTRSSDLTEDTKNEALWHSGLQAIAQGHVAVLLLAGGQGTRLGSSDPKGMYDIQTPSHKSLFQLQAERIRRLERLAADYASNSEKKCVIPWYIMTSRATHLKTIQYFEKKDFFGLGKENVVFFQQGLMPCLDDQGKIMMATRNSVATSPDGNGGIYRAVMRQGIIDDMKDRGVQYINVHGVDNALVRVADPLFIGLCVENKSDCGQKVVPKASPEEAVGVFAKDEQERLCVAEYSEISAEQASQRNPETGELMFNAANIAYHLYSLDFFEQCAQFAQDSITDINSDNHRLFPYHSAFKKIKTLDNPEPQEPNGWKMELFIFDLFRLADANKTSILQVDRTSEFAPVKNAPGSKKDSPDTARALLSSLHKSFLTEAGAQISSSSNDALCEVSPLLSYKGEGLEHFKGKKITLPCNLEKDQ